MLSPATHAAHEAPTWALLCSPASQCCPCRYAHLGGREISAPQSTTREARRAARARRRRLAERADWNAGWRAITRPRFRVSMLVVASHCSALASKPWLWRRAAWSRCGRADGEGREGSGERSGCCGPADRDDGSSGGARPRRRSLYTRAKVVPGACHEVLLKGGQVFGLEGRLPSFYKRVREIKIVMTALVSRTGRHQQRYEHGYRLVAGCIPYRYRLTGEGKCMEVLMISSQRGEGLLFPKGGWENDETVEEAACREALEEAGVRGLLQDMLGTWDFKSKRQQGVFCPEGLCRAYMFALAVTEQLDTWPEQHSRQRQWFAVSDAIGQCRHDWMRGALDQCVAYLAKIPSE